MPIVISDLEKLCEYIETHQTNSAETVALFKSHVHYNKQRSFSLDFYERKFSEIEIKLLIGKFALEFPEIKIKTMYFPIEKKEVLLKTSLDELYIYSKKQFEKSNKKRKMKLIPKLTYENLLLIENRPAIVESSLTKFPSFSELLKKARVVYNRIKTHPYHLVITTENNLSSCYAEAFRNSGGVIGIFHTTLKDFRQKVENIVKEFELPHTNPYKPKSY